MGGKTYQTMAIEAIRELKNYSKGSSLVAIKSYISANYPKVDFQSKYLSSSLKKGIEDGVFEKCNASYKLTAKTRRAAKGASKRIVKKVVETEVKKPKKAKATSSTTGQKSAKKIGAKPLKKVVKKIQRKNVEKKTPKSNPKSKSESSSSLKKTVPLKKNTKKPEVKKTAPLKKTNKLAKKPGVKRAAPAAKKLVPKPKRASAIASSSTSTPSMFSAFGSAAQSHIPCRTEVDLRNYDYGTDPLVGTTSSSSSTSSSSTHKGKLDLVFCLDCTGSMASTIKGCQDSIVSLANTLMTTEGQDVRFSLIPYRDHGSSEQYCTKVYPFTRATAQMLKNVQEQSASGGGDTPEAVTAALYEALMLDWREDAAKLVVIMADAPPHGMGAGHSFPNGDPDGKDPLCVAREMAGQGVLLYSLVTGGASRDTMDIFAALSSITGGQCMRVSDSALLQELVLGGARENVDIESRMGRVREALARASSERRGRPSEGESAAAELTETESAEITRRVLEEDTSTSSSSSSSSSSTSSSTSSVRSLPEDKLIRVSAERLAAAESSPTILEMWNQWKHLPSSNVGHSFMMFSSSSGAGTGVGAGITTSTSSSSSSSAPSSESSLTDRITKMARSREAKASEGPVIVECFKEGSKIRARIISPGYDSSKNCQFPRDIREEGKQFQVEKVINAGTFYMIKGTITPL